MYWEDTDTAKDYAEKGILLLIPYNNPWAWMNPQAIAYTDEIINVLFEKYNLSDDLPLVAVGGSMGGLSALVYTRYAKRTTLLVLPTVPQGSSKRENIAPKMDIFIDYCVVLS